MEISVKLRLITPLFMGGSDPRGNPELRAASFRGVLRFWLRALLGGALGGDSRKVFEHESRVFGSTEHASAVAVKAKWLAVKEPQDYNPLPHKSPRFRFKGFPPGSSLVISFLSYDAQSLEMTTSALRLLCNLGGLGRRSRRGFGSLEILEPEEWAIRATTPEELGQHLRETVGQAVETVQKFVGQSKNLSQELPPFPFLHPNWSQVKVTNEIFDNWQSAIREVMRKAHDFKNPALGWAAPRQASPIHVHVTRLRNGGYTLVLTAMVSEVNPGLRSRLDWRELRGFWETFHGQVIWGVKEVPV